MPIKKLIGSKNIPVDASTLTTDPAGQIFGDLFRYSGGSYVKATEIQPGEGVWVYITGACNLTIP